MAEMKRENKVIDLSNSDSESERERGNSDVSDNEFSDEDQNGKFSFQAKNVGLTYSQCPLDMSEMEIGIAGLKGALANYDKLLIGQEKHQDGATHYHVYIHWPNKVKTKDVRAFDIEGYHPNVRRFPAHKGQSQILKWIAYCQKGGIYCQYGFPSELQYIKDFTNYRSKKADVLAFQADAKAQGLGSPYPFLLPNGVEVKRPSLIGDEYVKKRHYLIVGRPDCGKSKWVSKTFGSNVVTGTQGKKVYLRPDTKSPFEAETYRQEPVIIYDDLIPNMAEVRAPPVVCCYEIFMF